MELNMNLYCYSYSKFLMMCYSISYVLTQCASIDLMESRKNMEFKNKNA